MMMSPTALIDTAGPGTLPGAPDEVDNGAPDGGGGVCPVAADVPLCPPAVVHAAVSNVRVSSADTRRQRGGRLAGAQRRAASMPVLWALPDGGTGRLRTDHAPGPPPSAKHTFAGPDTAARARPRTPTTERGRPSRSDRSRAPGCLRCRNMHLPRRSPRPCLTPASPAPSAR